MQLVKHLLILITALSVSICTQAASVWKVSSDKHSLYVGGTFHMLTPNDYPLPKEYDIAYKASNKLIFETDIAVANSPEFGQSIMAKMAYSDGTTVNKVLKPETITLLKEHLTKRGIPFEAFASFKPSLISITLSVIEIQAMGFTSEGVDLFYSKLAAKQNKPQGWLETPDEQIEFLMNMGKGQEDMMIEYTIRDIKKMPELMGKLQPAWRNGDMKTMAEVGIKPMRTEFPDMYRDLLVTRNNKWIPQIVNMLADDTIEFVLVGALHLSGPDSVLAQLEAKGYKVEKL